VDVRPGKVERWTTASETGGIKTENFSRPEWCGGRSFDGKMISGCLYQPPANLPANDRSSSIFTADPKTSRSLVPG